jgi:hypothetical protein
VILPLVTAALSVVWAMGITAARLQADAVDGDHGGAGALGRGGSRADPEALLTKLSRLGENRAAVAALAPAHQAGDGDRVLRIAAAGFGSLATFGIPAVRDFGLMAAFGILSTLVLELSFIPACRALPRAPRSAEAVRERSHTLLDPALDGLTRAVSAQPRAAIALAATVVALASFGIPRIEVNSAFRSWFDTDAPVIAADNAIRARFTGTSTIRVLIEGDEPDALLDPQVLRGMAALQRSFREEEAITTPSRRRLRAGDERATNDGAPEAYAVPDSREAIEQYLLFEPGDLSRVVSSITDRRDPRARADASRGSKRSSRLRGRGARVPPAMRSGVAASWDRRPRTTRPSCATSSRTWDRSVR